MKCLILIPARGGSKGLPGKNLADVGGLSLVGRASRLAVRAIVKLGKGSRAVCSTDDDRIAAEARLWGVETPFVRPAVLATDQATSVDVVLHALDSLDENFEAVVLLQPTSPLTELSDVLGAVEMFAREQTPVVSVTPAEHPPEWHFTLDAQSRLSPRGEARPHRRQDAAASVRPNGAIFIAAPSSLRKDRAFLTKETRGFVMPAERSVDIDARTDLEVARSLLARRPVESISIAGRRIGPGEPCFLIAEAGVNHNGDLGLAKELIDAAAAAGADAVKFQTFRAETLVSRDAPKADYQLRRTAAEQTQFEMLKALELGESAHRELIEHCVRRGLLFLSTPFDEWATDLLDDLGVAGFKIASGELTNSPLLRHVASKGKPVILSTGMANLPEVAKAVDVLRDGGCRELVLLHCVSNYPADPAEANLRAMASLSQTFGVPAGFSDHTEGDAVALGAVALGACVVEKHFTLDRTLAGPDHQASIEPEELRQLVQRVRIVESALGDGKKSPSESEMKVAQVARKSIIAAARIPAGTRLNSEMVALRRPGTGLAPEEVGKLLGRVAVVDIDEGAMLREEMFR